MKLLKKLIAAIVLVPALAFASEGGFPLDRAPDRSSDMAALQNGAKLFVNNCLNCHAAASMRYNRLTDIGLNNDQIKDNLMFTGVKVGDLMQISMAPKDAKEWFGAVPPDLSVIARARSTGEGSGSDWLYTYLRTFYKDETRPTGWNNMVFPNVGMPHVLWELQGTRTAKFAEEKDPHSDGVIHKFSGFEQVAAGKLSANDYDAAVGDLVGYLQWMAEPVQNTRKKLGIWVLLFLGIFFVVAWRLNAAFWKDIK